MKTITIKTQKELDALPDKFDEHTRIEIRSSGVIVVRKAYNNTRVVAHNNATVEAYNNAAIEAFGNTTVIAYNNATVIAYNNVTVEAFDNTTIEAWRNATVVASGNATVKAFENATIKAYNSTTVKAFDNATVGAYDNATVSLFLSAYVIILSSSVHVKKLLDYSTAVFKGCPESIEEKSETAQTREIPIDIEASFEEWLRRGYVVADGICKKLKSQKKINDIEVFECEDFPHKTTSYVVKRGDAFSHGETVGKAIEDLRYKVGNRDTSEFEHWRNDLDQEISFEDAIAAYRTITGACEMGVEEFVQSIEVPEKLTPRKVLKLTEGQYGHEEFSKFLEEKAKEQGE